MQIHYVDSHRWAIPVPLDSDQCCENLRDFKANIRLDLLASHWPKNEKVFKDDPLLLRVPFYRKWDFKFTDKHYADISGAGNRTNCFGTWNDDDSIMITFDSSLLEIARVVDSYASPEKSAPARGWKLRDLAVVVPRRCPMMNVIAIFAPESPSFIVGKLPNMRAFNDLSNALEELWPLFYAVLKALGCGKSRNSPPALEANILAGPQLAWDSCASPFGIPNVLHRKRHWDFDPSQELQFTSNFMVLGDAAEQEAFRTHTCAKLQVLNAASSLSPMINKVSMSSGGTVVWEVVVGDCPITEFRDVVLRTVLGDDLLKHWTFQRRLSTAMLNEAATDRDGCDAKEVRKLVYLGLQQTEFYLRRNRLSGEPEREFFDANLLICNGREDERAARDLGNILIAFAEELENEQQQESNDRLQRLVSAVGIVAVIATCGSCFSLFVQADEYIHNVDIVARNPARAMWVWAYAATSLLMIMLMGIACWRLINALSAAGRRLSHKAR